MGGRVKNKGSKYFLKQDWFRTQVAKKIQKRGLKVLSLRRYIILEEGPH